MGLSLSKSTRICILLGIDSVFFLLELVVGYAVHSLALVADSFHMLNDVLSLCVGLWAVKVANQKSNSKMYTYGWQRAETLGALVNGVFLVALCLSIFLEAIQRFVEPQEVSNPMLVLIVGCCGLASNILGLFLFHDHGHSHGGHSHGEEGHSHSAKAGQDELSSAEQGHSTAVGDDNVGDESGNIADVLPQNRVGGWPRTQKSTEPGEGSETTAVEDAESTNPKSGPAYRHSKHKSSRSRSRTYSSVEDMPVNPASFRKSIIDASRLDEVESDENTEDDTTADDHSHDIDHSHSTSEQPLLHKANGKGYGAISKKRIDHKSHKHAQPKDAKSGGHSHADLNMRGVFLHVMGDALGNIGVIASALFIWLTDFSWRFYSDPLISLIITVIILCSAIPLCKAASRILLQAVPAGLSIDDIEADINDLPGIISCHHLHVWQLSDTKLVASLHIQIDYDFKGEGSARYMELARAIRECFSAWGVSSVTVQPEMCLDPEHDHVARAIENGQSDESAEGSKPRSKAASNAASVHGEPDACMLDCQDGCGPDKAGPGHSSKKDDHQHGHDHGHSH